MKRNWIYVQNPFLIATDDSYALAVLISAFHLAALRGANGISFFDDLAEAYQINDPVFFNRASNPKLCKVYSPNLYCKPPINCVRDPRKPPSALIIQCLLI